jgi:hypothetical protein
VRLTIEVEARLEGRPTKLGVFLFCLLLAGSSLASAQSAPLAGGRRLYVSMTGSDSNPGTRQRPFATLQHAADVARPGDYVDLRGGTYCQRVAIASSGSRAAGYITFESAPGETAVLDGGCLLRRKDQAR